MQIQTQIDDLMRMYSIDAEYEAKVEYVYEYDSGYTADADAHADAEADHINSPPLLCKLQSSSLAESSFSPFLSPMAPLTH